MGFVTKGELAESARRLREQRTRRDPTAQAFGGSSAKCGTSCANAEPTHILWASEDFQKLGQSTKKACRHAVFKKDFFSGQRKVSVFPLN